VQEELLLLHDNTPTHRSVLVQEELAKQQTGDWFATPSILTSPRTVISYFFTT
jgi:hypothetical protein